MLEVVPYFEGSSLTLAPNLRQGERFFCVLVCCTGSAVYLAGRHLKKSGKLDLNLKDSTLQSAFLAPKFLLLKVYTKRQIALSAEQANTAYIVVQEKIFTVAE